MHVYYKKRWGVIMRGAPAWSRRAGRAPGLRVEVVRGHKQFQGHVRLDLELLQGFLVAAEAGRRPSVPGQSVGPPGTDGNDEAGPAAGRAAHLFMYFSL